MAKEHYILFVEDSPEDVFLGERALRKGGVVFQSQQVETSEDLRRAIAEFKPDIILSDYSLPQLDGLSALKIAREACPDVPFIFVSGTIGEERVIESLKKGATDYVAKDQLSGLAAKVLRSLKDAEDRRQR